MLSIHGSELVAVAQGLVENIGTQIPVNFLDSTTKSQKYKIDSRSGMSRASRELLGRRACNATCGRQVFLHFPTAVILYAHMYDSMSSDTPLYTSDTQVSHISVSDTAPDAPSRAERRPPVRPARGCDTGDPITALRPQRTATDLQIYRRSSSSLSSLSLSSSSSSSSLSSSSPSLRSSPSLSSSSPSSSSSSSPSSSLSSSSST